MIDGRQADGERGLCPFCGAPWSDAMHARFEQSIIPSSCACCGSAPALHTPTAPPNEDICCDACGRAIFRALAVAPGAHS